MTSLAENAAKPPVMTRGQKTPVTSRGHKPPVMTRGHKIINLIGVPLPLVGLLAAIVLLWNRAVGPLELALLISTYVLTCLGVTLGYHRMFTHRAFESSRPFRAVVAVIGHVQVAGGVGGDPSRVAELSRRDAGRSVAPIASPDGKQPAPRIELLDPVVAAVGDI